MTAETGSEIDERTIRTSRLILRRPVDADIPAITAIANNHRIAQNLASMPHPFGEEDAAQWVARFKHADGKTRGGYMILLRGGEKLIGACGFGPVKDLRLPQLGYWVGEPYWGQGYATEAGWAVIDYVFNKTSIPVLGCGCRVTNHASRRVIDKCGFLYDGLGMMYSRYKDKPVPVLNFSIDRETWEMARSEEAA